MPAQPTLTIFAGGLPLHGSADGRGAEARFNAPWGLAVDGDGNVYVADGANNTIRKITPGGAVTTHAGLAGTEGHADGHRLVATFKYPQYLAFDAAGTLYVADNGNNTIRTISPAGEVATLAGSAGTGGFQDGPGTTARFNGPCGLAVNEATGQLVVADANNSVIRLVDRAGTVTTLAGRAGTVGGQDDTEGGTGEATFNFPMAVAVDGQGRVYVADNGLSTLRVIQLTTGAVSTLAGAAGQFGSKDGKGGAAVFNGPIALAMDGAGNILVADSNNHTLRKVTPEGEVTTLAGKAGLSGATNGPAAKARFNGPEGLAVNAAGEVLVAEGGNNLIRKITRAGKVSTLAGKVGGIGSADGAGPAASFRNPRGVAMDAQGNLFVTDHDNFIVRKITRAGVVSTLAGRAGEPGHADGIGAAARFGFLDGVAIDRDGNVVVADFGNHTIRQITQEGVVTTLAGMAGVPGSADGAALQARFDGPWGVAVDGDGTMFVSDSNNNTLRRLEAGQVSTFAGQAGPAGAADGHGGKASFSAPQALAMDRAGNLIVADAWNNTVRMVTAAGQVSTLAGTAGTEGSDDGTGTSARFNEPFGITVDAAGNLYVSDCCNATIRKLTFTPAGVVVTTSIGVAGGPSLLAPDVPPATLPQPAGLIVDPATGDLYILVQNAILVAKGLA